MFTGARFPDYCNGTSHPVQELTVSVLADLGSHEQPETAIFGYFTWETGRWQQEKQHQMSQVSDEYRYIQSETVSVKTSYALDVLPLAQYRDVGIDLQGSDGATEYGNGTWKLEASLFQRWIKIHAAEEMAVHVSKDAGMRSTQGTTSLRSTISAEEVWWCGLPTPEKLNLCTSPATLTPLDTGMRFWHYTCCPQWTYVGKFFRTTTVLPRLSMSQDLNPIEHLWDDLERRVRSRQPAPHTLQELWTSNS